MVDLLQDDQIHVCLSREGAAQNQYLFSEGGNSRYKQELQMAIKGKYPKANQSGSQDEEKFFSEFWTKVFTEKYKSLASNNYFQDPQNKQQEMYAGLGRID